MNARKGETRQCANTNRVSIEKSHARKIDMKSLQKNELTFHNTTFSHMEIGGQVWLTASEVGEALGYADDKAIHRLYRKHANEFTSNMTGVVKVTTPGGMQDVRMFSLRGAHLMGMFSRTPVAKEFRRWVLDILDREVENSPIAKQFTDEELITMSYLWSWMDRSQKLCRAVYPAMRDVESRYTGMFHDVGKETLYVIEESRKVLARETGHLKNSDSVRANRASKVLARIRGEALPDMCH